MLQIFEPKDGGVAEHVRVLALGLPREGWEVELAGPQTSMAYADASAAGVAIHRRALGPGLGNPLHDARQLAPLLRIVRAGRFDVVHCHSAKAGVLGRLVARAARVPAVYTPHSFPFEGDVFSRRRRAFAVAVEKTLAPLTARIVCVCAYERALAGERRLGPDGRFAVIRYGTPACPEAVEPDERLAALARQGPTAAVVAALRPQKSIDVFLEAAPLVLERLPSARLAVVGDGPEREALEALARRLGLLGDERFAFIPFQPPAARWLRAADLYVLPSAWEALPIGLLEALACGVPQVATDVGGTAEALTPETGLLVPSRDPGALADAMVALLGDADRRRAMAEASRGRHAEHFALERMVADTAALYGDILGRRP